MCARSGPSLLPRCPLTRFDTSLNGACCSIHNSPCHMQVQPVGLGRALSCQPCFVSFQGCHDSFPLCLQHIRGHPDFSKWQMDLMNRNTVLTRTRKVHAKYMFGLVQRAFLVPCRSDCDWGGECLDFQCHEPHLAHWNLHLCCGPGGGY